MVTKRFFSGSRDNSRHTVAGMVAAKIRRMELQRGGKLPLTAADRYKMVMDMRMEEHRNKTSMSAYSTFMLKGATASARKMSKGAEQAMKQMAQKKAVKEAKRLAQMVVIKPRWYGGMGQINKKGVVFDHVGNITLRVDPKTGRIKTPGGWLVGKYKPKSMLHDGLMQDWIKKHSPYHMQLQKMELQRQIAAMYDLQQNGAVTVHGLSVDPAQYMQQLQEAQIGLGQSQVDVYGNALNSGSDLNSIGRTNIDATGWGVRSGNVWGTFGENTWGGFADNVHGTTNNNIWGGIGDSGGLWKGPGRPLFRSGNGTNYIAKWGGVLKAFFGFGGRSRNSRGGAVSRGSGAQMRFASPVGTRSGGASGSRPGAAPRGRR